uniref:C2H2-type domain-containing protein n=1 Tax=Parascaris univalens TaxID=6257 RepID=A0A915AIK8_PARUN
MIIWTGEQENEGQSKNVSRSQNFLSRQSCVWTSSERAHLIHCCWAVISTRQCLSGRVDCAHGVTSYYRSSLRRFFFKFYQIARLMIASVNDRPYRLFGGSCSLSELELPFMDPNQQQRALQQFYQHQTINNYLVAINTIRSSPSCASSFISSTFANSSMISALTPTSLTSPAQSPTSDSSMSSLLAANNPRLPVDVSLILPNASTISKPLASYAQPRAQQQISLPSAMQSPDSLNPLAATQLARLQLMTLQAEGEKQAENLKAEQFGLLAMQVAALQNSKPSEEAVQIGGVLQQSAVNDRHTSRPEFARLTAKDTSLLPKSSVPPILSSPTPESTPSPLYESASPTFMESEASRSSKDNGEDDEEALYVDVESLDDRVGSKGQRKAHIDFYRKLKALRQREKILECQVCHKKVENREHSIRTHVHSHSDTALYRCKMCGAESKEHNAMFAHITQYHPKKGHDGFEDRRDMANLSNILLKCFPRATAKTRIGYNEIIDKICKNIESKSLTKVTCALCMKSIGAQKTCISRHAHTHSYFRCKQCKLTCAEETDIVEHCTKSHNVMEPKITRDFNMCSAADVMLVVVKKCFPTLVCEQNQW